MKLDSKDTQRALAGLKDNGFFAHYVKMLEALRESAVTTLLYSDHPDEALRGEARSYDKMLKDIRKNTL